MSTSTTTPPSIGDKDREAITAIYELAIRSREFEINQLVQRNNFFMIFQGVLMAGFLQALSNQLPVIASFMACITGVFVALLQIGMAAGAKFWQERWEYAVESCEEKLLEFVDKDSSRKKLFEVFTSGDAHIDEVVRNRVASKFMGSLINFRFSPSRLPIYAGMVFLVIWSVLALHQIDLPVVKWLTPLK